MPAKSAYWLVRTTNLLFSFMLRLMQPPRSFCVFASPTFDVSGSMAKMFTPLASLNEMFFMVYSLPHSFFESSVPIFVISSSSGSTGVFMPRSLKCFCHLTLFMRDTDILPFLFVYRVPICGCVPYPPIYKSFSDTRIS